MVLPDKTRCDGVTETHAIEFDFGNQLTGPSTCGSACALTIHLINLSNEIHGSDSGAHFIGTHVTL